MSEFKRPIEEDYGPSSVRIEKLNMENGFDTVDVNGVRVMLPVLNMKKYNPNVECYAFIERIYGYSMTMVDVLYAYTDISAKFENDEKFRREFLSTYNRKYINSNNLKSPALIMVPKREYIAGPFANALKLALQDSAGAQILAFRNESQEKIQIELPPQPGTVKEDGIVLEFIKDFYEAISRTRVKRPTDLKVQNVTCSVLKEAMIMKSGATIVDSEQVSKYFTTFQTKIDTNEKKDVKDSLAVHIAGIDETLLTSSLDYRKKFGDVLLTSNILEALSYSNGSKLPIMALAGRYSEETNRIVVDKQIEKQFNKINELLVPTRPSDDGR